MERPPLLLFAVKIPLFPFHTWLPDAYCEAPASTTFVLSAIMAKIGVYGVIRLVLPVFGAELAHYGVFCASLAVIGLIYCGITAFVQKDMKRLLAFSSASHMGVIAVGLFCMNSVALTGTLFQIVAHATSTGLLFLFVALIEQRTGGRQIASFGGVAYGAPVFATFFAIAMLASCGLPGTSGFIGEFLILLGAVKFNLVIAVLAGTTLIIGVCYMLWLFQRVFFEKASEEKPPVADLSLREVALFLPVIILIFVMGIYPQPFIAKVEPSVKRQIGLMDLPSPAQYVNYPSLSQQNND
jgi:NADH-quinone oxidoreductase subunit M